MLSSAGSIVDDLWHEDGSHVIESDVASPAASRPLFIDTTEVTDVPGNEDDLPWSHHPGLPVVAAGVIYEIGPSDDACCWVVDTSLHS